MVDNILYQSCINPVFQRRQVTKVKLTTGEHILEFSEQVG
jgi:hypothetical protein